MSTFGRYRLIAELGRGGMATVFLAVTEGAMGINFNKLVVLKRLREHVADDPEFVTMLMDEARIAARLNHPNVVQTLEVDKAEGEPFLAMEYLDGQPLHRILSRDRATFPLAMFLAVLADVLSGLHHAHELADFDGTPLNIVHRDVTPHNVFVTYNGQVKVVDFGIAKAEGRASETKHGVVKGKVSYMAPEQARSGMLDRRTDVFAVGVMLFEACTRRRMWQGMPDVEILRALIHEQYRRSPRELVPDIHEELDRICQKALAAKLEDRYPTAEALSADLEAFMRAHAPRPSQRELGAHIARLFKDKRDLTKQVIESQLADLKSSQSKSLKLVAIPQEPASSTSLPHPGSPSNAPTKLVPMSPHELPSAPPPVTRVEPPSAAPPPDVPARLVRIGLLAAVAVGAALVIAFAFAPRSEGADASTTNVVKVPAEITITLRASPNSARFRIDDGPVLDNPYVGRFGRSQAEHTVQAFAPGYETKVQRVKLTEDLSVRFALARSVDAQTP